MNYRNMSDEQKRQWAAYFAYLAVRGTGRAASAYGRFAGRLTRRAARASWRWIWR